MTRSIYDQKESYLQVFTGILFFLALIFSFIAGKSANNWESFPDCRDYLEQATRSLLSIEFWFPAKGYYFSPRPFTAPLIFKLCGGNYHVIVVVQKIVHFGSALLFCFSLVPFLSRNYLKYVLTSGIFLIFSWWNILGWTQQVLSESLSFSFLFLWISSLLLLVHRAARPFFVIHVIVTILFAYTRDTWPYILPPFYIVFLFINLRTRTLNWRRTSALLALSVFLFVVQQWAVKRGERHLLPFTNSIMVRVLKNEVYLQYFTLRGMPQTGQLKEEFKGVDLRNPVNRGMIYSLYHDTKFGAFRDWAKVNGSKVYASFLLSHPRYLFLLDEPTENKKLFLSTNLYYYTGAPPHAYSWLDAVFPFMRYQVMLALAVLLLSGNLFRSKTNELVLLLFGLALALHALMVYNADALEVDRHLFYNSLFIEILGLVYLVIVADRIKYSKMGRWLKSKKGMF